MRGVGMAAATAALIQPGGEGRPYDRETAEWQRFAGSNFSSRRRSPSGKWGARWLGAGQWWSPSRSCCWLWPRAGTTLLQARRLGRACSATRAHQCSECLEPLPLGDSPIQAYRFVREW